MTHERRPGGRPRIYQHQRWHVHTMLSAEVVAAIDAIAPGNRSAFIEAWLRQHPQVAERLTQQTEQPNDR